MWKIVYTKKAADDITKLKAAKLDKKQRLLLRCCAKIPSISLHPMKSFKEICLVLIPEGSISNIVWSMRFWRIR